MILGSKFLVTWSGLPIGRVFVLRVFHVLYFCVCDEDHSGDGCCEGDVVLVVVRVLFAMRQLVVIAMG